MLEVLPLHADLGAGYNSRSVERIGRRLAPQQNGFQSGGGFLREIADLEELRGALKSGVKLGFEMRELVSESESTSETPWARAEGAPAE